jgi:hypothetical protein
MVGDSSFIREDLRQVLRPTGGAGEEAQDGREALTGGARSQAST